MVSRQSNARDMFFLLKLPVIIILWNWFFFPSNVLWCHHNLPGMQRAAQEQLSSVNFCSFTTFHSLCTTISIMQIKHGLFKHCSWKIWFHTIKQLLSYRSSFKQSQIKRQLFQYIIWEKNSYLKNCWSQFSNFKTLFP